MDMLFTVTNQSIVRTDTNLVVADSINYLYATFSFSGDWNQAKTAIFRKLITGEAYEEILTEDRCLVPYQVLIGPGDFTVSVYSGNLHTANTALINLCPSGYTEDVVPPTEAIVLTGNAEPGDVIKLKTFYKDDPYTKLTGTLELLGTAGAMDVRDGKLFYSTDPKAIMIGGLIPADEVILTGDAAVGDVLLGKTFYNDDPELERTGTLALTGDALAGDVRAGKKFYKDDAKTQLTGTLDPISEVNLTGDAAIANVLAGKTFYNTDPETELTGTMPNRAGDNASLLTANVADVAYMTPPAGFYDGIDDRVYEDGLILIAPEDYDAAFESLYVAQYASPSMIHLRLSDLKKLAMSGTYNELGNPTGILYDLHDAEPRLHQSVNNIFKMWGRQPADFSSSITYGMTGSQNYGLCIDQLNDTDAFFFVGFSTGEIYKVDKDDIANNAAGCASPSYGGAVNSVACLGDFVYGAGATTQRVRKYSYSELAYIAQSADYGGTIQALTKNATHIFAGGATTKKVVKYLPADLSVVHESDTLSDTIMALAVDDTHVYAACADGRVYKLLLSDLSTVTSSLAYTGIIYALIEYGSYIYFGGGTTKRVYKALKSTLGVTAQSAAYSGNIRGLALGDLVEV